MDRLSLKNLIKNNSVSLSKTSDVLYCVFDGNDFVSDRLNITLEKGCFANLLLVNYKGNTELEFNLEDDSSLKIETLFVDANQSLKMNANVANNAQISAYLADFSEGVNNSVVTINLNGEGSSAFWKLASISKEKDKKTFDVSIIHNATNTNGLSDNYGVSKDGGDLVFSGISHIKNGSKFSKTRQNAKIVVFDEGAIARARPILKIDENEIEASHGASVGTVNEDQIYYLTSRGIKEELAKQLISLGYIKPILDGFSDEEIKDQINELIEGRM